MNTTSSNSAAPAKTAPSKSGKARLLVVIGLILVVVLFLVLSLPASGPSAVVMYSSASFGNNKAPFIDNIRIPAPASGNSAAASAYLVPPAVANEDPQGTLVVAGDDDAPCESYKSCLPCLFTTSGGNAPSNGALMPSLRNRCVWCAGLDSCVDARNVTDTSKCTGRKTPPPNRLILPTFKTDIEERSCPAILHDLPPQSIRTINVPFKTGGPEALIQLFLALEKWGYRSSLDTMGRLPGGQIDGFFADKYREELLLQPRLREYSSHEEWQVSGLEGDIIMSADFRHCNTHDDKVIYGKPREAVYDEMKRHAKALAKILGIDSNDDETINNSSSGIRQELDTMYYVPSDHRNSREMRYMLADVRTHTWPHCSLVGHTNHISIEFLRQSSRALVFPYASPHILKHAEEWLQKTVGSNEGSVLSPKIIAQKVQSGKENVAFVDNDAGYDWQARNKPHYSVAVASGFSPDALYNKYTSVRVAADFNVRGGERFIYEAGAYGNCVVIDNDRNAMNRVDFPVPEVIRVKKHAKREDFVTDVIGRFDACFEWADRDLNSKAAPKPLSPPPLDGIDPANMTLWEAYEPLRNHIALQKSNMERQARRYFSNSLHVVTAVLTEEDAKERLVPFILATLFQMPFATIEVVFASRALRNLVPADLLGGLHAISLMSAVTFTVLSSPEPFGPNPQAAARPANNETAYADVAADLRDTVALLMERRKRGIAPPLTPSPRSVAPQTTPLMSLYTAILPLSAATGNEGEFVHYLGSVMTLLATSGGGNVGLGSSSANNGECRTKDPKAALGSSMLSTSLSMLNPHYHRHHLRAMNHLATTAAEGYFWARDFVLNHLDRPNIAAGRVNEEHDEQEEHSLTHLTKMFMQKHMRLAQARERVVRPACGRDYARRSGLAVVATGAEGIDKDTVLALFWRTSEEPAASAAIEAMLQHQASSALKASPEKAPFFAPTPNTFEALPKVPERTLYGKAATPYTNHVPSGPLVRVKTSLVVPMRSVVSAEAVFLGSGHLPVATLPSLRVEPFLPPASAVRSFLCEHEAWRRMVDKRRGAGHTECPNAQGYEPLIDDFLEKSLGVKK